MKRESPPNRTKNVRQATNFIKVISSVDFHFRFLSLGRGWSQCQPVRLLFHNFVSGLQLGRLFHHGAHRAILFLGQTDGFLDRSAIDLAACDHVDDANSREHLRRPLRLIGLDSHFVAGHFLVVLLAKDRNHVESGAAGQRDGDQFNRLGAGASGRVIEQDVVLASRRGDKLAFRLKWLELVGPLR